MKLTTLLSIGSIFLFAAACGTTYYDYYGDEGYYEEEYYDEYGEEDFSQYENQGTYNPQQTSGRATANPSRGNGQVVMHTIRDPKTGNPSIYLPLPANWKVTPQGITGPNGITIQDFPGASLQGRQVSSIDQIINTDIAQNIRKNGAQLLRVIDLPEIARKDQQMYAQYWQAMPAQNSHEAKGIEIKDASGKLGLIVVHFLNSRSQYGNFAFYYMNVMTANPSAYESAKAAALYGLANQQQDPQALAAHNQREQQKSNASWAAHNQKMRNNQANFDSWQKTQQTYSEISDISHEGWKRRNGMTDAGHSNSINGIWEREATVNPYSGQQTTVDSGYKYYYMNSDGQYFGTNDEFYNPMQDPNLNHTQWRKVQRPRNNY